MTNAGYAIIGILVCLFSILASLILIIGIVLARMALTVSEHTELEDYSDLEKLEKKESNQK